MFADKFVQLLQIKGVTAYRMSKDTGISSGLISGWMQGNKLPSGENLLKIANYFNVTADCLLRGDAKIQPLPPDHTSMPRQTDPPSDGDITLDALLAKEGITDEQVKSSIAHIIALAKQVKHNENLEMSAEFFDGNYDRKQQQSNGS